MKPRLHVGLHVRVNGVPGKIISGPHEVIGIDGKTTGPWWEVSKGRGLNKNTALHLATHIRRRLGRGA